MFNFITFFKLISLNFEEKCLKTKQLILFSEWDHPKKSTKDSVISLINKELNKEDGKAEFFIPKNADEGYINNKEEKRLFAFNQIFDMDAKQ